MSIEEVFPETTALLSLKVTAESDPGILARVLVPIQNLNVIPRRVLAECGAVGQIHIEIDIVGLAERRVALITSKIGEIPSVLSAHWHRR